MRGHVTGLTSTVGTIVSNTDKECTYLFTERSYLGDWSILQTDFANGVEIVVLFHKDHATPGYARLVRRLA